MALRPETEERIRSLIASNDVVLFMKGDRSFPQCGFSARVVQILDSLLPEYRTVDVLEDPEIREGIKEFSNWPTIPQLYVRGEFVGGCDIVSEMFMSGELHRLLGLEVPERKVPTIHITDAAARRLREFIERAQGRSLYLTIDGRYQAQMGFTHAQGTEIVAESNGIRVLMDPATAERAEGVTIDVVETEQGVSFRIDNPNAPSAVKQIAPAELRAWMEEGRPFELFDVRTPEEREIARIEGARLLDDEAKRHIERLPKDAVLVFHCHHGGRSQKAAEHFAALGYRNVYNLAGGIDAWSRDVDPSVPRY